ncbi:MAG: hypothetical protein Q9190_001103 [Brigantiaea leucoxantha]
MDPLSLTASIIALTTLTTQCLKAFSALRNNCRSLPGRLHALDNEVTDTHAVLTDISTLLAERGKKSIPEEEQGNALTHVNQLTTKLTELKNIVDSLTVLCSRSRTLWATAIAWPKVQGRLSSLQEDIKSAKSRLNLLLGTSNSRDLLHIRTQVESISTHSTILTDLQREILESVHGDFELQRDVYTTTLAAMQQRVEERIDKLEDVIRAQEVRLYESQANLLGPNYTLAAQRRRRSAAEKANQRPVNPRADSVGIRFTRYATTCRSGCPCRCHRQKKSSTPAILDRVIGQLFVGYSGIPGLSPKCDNESCQISQTAHIDLEYRFPLDFFWSQIVRLQVGYKSNIGPQFQLSTLRRVPDSAQSVEFAMGGNIDGLKYLFSRGQASPRDVSSTRGYSLLRWALYGKQYDTCQFLLHAGADAEYRPNSPFDQNPMDKAHDYLLQGRIPPSAEGALRELTRGSDFIDDQNFTLLHKSVLGLSFSSLEDAMLQHPDDIDTKDALGRTPLSWAALCGDDRAIALLLAHGADPNAVGIRDCPLSNAAGRGCTKGCRLLLEAGADPDINELSGYKTGSPLNVATRNSDDPLCFKTLLDFGASTECCGVDGRTPLIHVARTNNVSFALLLLEYGADVNATSVTGQTPLTTAITHNSHDVLRLLLERWFEYSECPRLKGGHLLKLLAESANLETIQILTTTSHIRLKYDKDYKADDYFNIIRDRFDADEKLVSAFEAFLAVVDFDPDAVTNAESLAEAGLLTSSARRVLNSGSTIPETDRDTPFENALEYLNLESDGEKSKSPEDRQ